MSTTLVIRVELSDESDLDWMRNKIMPAVESVCDEQAVRIDGVVLEVSWDEEQDGTGE